MFRSKERNELERFRFCEKIGSELAITSPACFISDKPEMFSFELSKMFGNETVETRRYLGIHTCRNKDKANNREMYVFGHSFTKHQLCEEISFSSFRFF